MRTLLFAALLFASACVSQRYSARQTTTSSGSTNTTTSGGAIQGVDGGTETGPTSVNSGKKRPSASDVSQPKTQ